MRKLVRLSTLLLVLAIPQIAMAQGQLGAVTGLVTDSSGASVPDAAITVTNLATGVRSKVKSSNAGYYRVPLLPGTYRVEAEKASFKAEVLEQVVVSVEQVVTLDVSLQVGSQTQTVEETGGTSDHAFHSRSGCQHFPKRVPDSAHSPGRRRPAIQPSDLDRRGNHRTL